MPVGKAARGVLRVVDILPVSQESVHSMQEDRGMSNAPETERITIRVTVQYACGLGLRRINPVYKQ